MNKCSGLTLVEILVAAFVLIALGVGGFYWTQSSQNNGETGGSILEPLEDAEDVKDLLEDHSQDLENELNGGSAPIPKVDDNIKTFSEYFSNELGRIGVQQIGATPIEGFDAFTLLRAFPGLLNIDFDGVEAIQGVYQYSESDLEFIQRAVSAVHSAWQTVSAEGYSTLLENVSLRLEVVVESEEDIDEMINILLR